MATINFTPEFLAKLIYHSQVAYGALASTLARKEDYGVCSDKEYNKLEYLYHYISYLTKVDGTEDEYPTIQIIYEQIIKITGLTYKDIIQSIPITGATTSGCGCKVGIIDSLTASLVEAVAFSVAADAGDTFNVQGAQTVGFYGINGVFTYTQNDNVFIGVSRTADNTTRIISGGEATYAGANITYNVQPATYLIGGAQYSSGGGVTVHSNGDATYDRFDAIIFDTNGDVGVLEGVPAENPLYPYVDPTLYVATQFILIQANQTSNPSFVERQMYDEHLEMPDEWNVQETQYGDPDNTLNPYKNTKSIRVHNNGSTQTAIAPFNLSTTDPAIPQDAMTHMEFQLYVKGGTTIEQISVRAGYDSVLNVLIWLIQDGKYGFNAALKDTWQRIVLPIDDYDSRYTNDPINKFFFSFFIQEWAGSGDIYVDDIKYIYDPAIAPPPSVGDVTLKEVGIASVTADDSIYTMTDKIPVIFRNFSQDTLLHLDGNNLRLGIKVVPEATLDVNGTFRFFTGNQGEGKYWRSNAGGFADWALIDYDHLINTPTISYISNVSLSDTTLTFTGIGDAFNSSVDLTSLAGGITWVEVGVNTVLAIDTGYISNGGGTLTHTLPLTSPVGSVIELAGKAGGWVLEQNAGQYIVFGVRQTTTGTGGSLASNELHDSIKMVCIVADTAWLVLSSVGNITVT